MQREVLIPTYMKSFACIGSACEDSCCIGWRVNLDKKTYKNYKNLKHPELGMKLRKSIKRIKNEESSESKYAYIVMDQKARCPMLEESGLCGIQAKLGEHMLSSTCTSYPRIVNKVNRMVEVSSKLSCPEAARLALMNPDGIEFDHMEYEVNPIWGMKESLDTTKTSNGEHLFEPLRIFTIEVIQNRNLQLSDRMVFLGLFIDKLKILLKEKSFNQVELLINEYRSKINSPQFINSLSAVHISLDLQLRLVIEFIQARNLYGGGVPRYKECYSDMITGLGITDEDSFNLNDLIKKYKESYSLYYAEFIEEYGYILENYLVNYIFENLFPNLEQGNVFDQYIRMSVLYAMLRIHLVGVSGAYKGLVPEMALKVIQSFTRVVEHNTSYINSITELLETNGLNKLAHIAAMLKE
ncbi:flagellin lysine-N-methylase [Paenibacillus sp. MDMC362]|uniref:flagellin lysine-N-methylase n=1 Tax=Paenibacillus sp. MDMC362 TaxID=2977365 RepID=UPI000DC21A2F|nr:flagellin lysine-N-methylase [Paenibacillus sp. MDMC362]RAR42444.1 hypothetical protein DP091_18765 [Paenibacillus sp. MDMC362]